MEAPPDLVAHSPRMHEVLRVARRVGAVQTTVLITGESGVGKERIARLVHESSPRPVDRFVAVNCGALDDNLLGSELFGHNKGGFTGAGADREGLFEAANGGTLFLDEIGEVTPAMQVKLLRVLQEGQFRRMGDTALRTTDARIVAATNRDLAAEVEAGRFRRDLYYRLRVVEIHVPPLRERPGDILAIARYLLASTAERLDRKDLRGMTPATVKALIAYRWPGNVRELQNAIERAVVLAEGPHLDLQDLPAEVTAPPLASHQSLEAVARQHITAVLESVGGNRERAAKLLGIAPATLYRRLKKWRQS
ncbi:MAG: sigma 54-interacting transcriptional regulator [Myxococcota bacterium]